MKINKAVWIGAMTGGLYALILFIYAIFNQWEIYTNLLFFPARITFQIIGGVITLVFLLMDLMKSLDGPSSLLLVHILNVPLWILIGGLVGKLVGKLIPKIKAKLNKR